jgi:hypothetical protein
MLLKLLKHEFIQTGRLFLWLLGGGIVLGGVGALLTLKSGSDAQLVTGFVWNVVLIVAASLLMTLSLFILLISNNRSLFTERGYLTFALPVSPSQMLFSKLAANVIYMLACIAEGLGMFFLAASNIKRLFVNAADTSAFPSEMMDEFSDIMGLPSFQDIVRFLGYVLLVLFFYMILAMMIVLFVLTISHVRPFQAVPWIWMIFFSVAATAVSVFLIKNIGVVAPSLDVTLRLFGTGFMDAQDMSLNLTNAVSALGITTGLFFLTSWLMKRKISLK